MQYLKIYNILKKNKITGTKTVSLSQEITTCDDFFLEEKTIEDSSINKNNNNKNKHLVSL